MTTQRLANLRRVIQAQNLDAVVITDPHNRRYLTGFTGSAGWLVISADKQFIITDSRYWGQCATQCPQFEIVKHLNRPEQPEKLRDTLKAVGAQKVGFEADNLTVSQFQQWKEKCTDVEFVATSELVERLRSLKEPVELEKIRRAVALTDKAYEHIRRWIEPGMSEGEVAWELESFMRTRGADGMAFDVHVASGPGTAEPHHASGERKIQVGEPIWIDMGARVEGYCADCTRSFTLGEPDEQFKRIYDIVLRAQIAALNALKAGLPGKEADGIARKVIEDAGFGDNYGHGLGHGVGLFIHEKPSAGRVSEDTLQAGQLLTVEPGIYIPGWGGVRIEDVVIIQEGGVENLTTAPK